MSGDKTVDGMTVVHSVRTVPDVMERLQALMKARGIRVFAHLDFSADAAAEGIRLRPTQLLIAGAPKAGTPLIEEEPSVAIDLPLKVLAWSEDGRFDHRRLQRSGVSTAPARLPGGARQEYLRSCGVGRRSGRRPEAMIRGARGHSSGGAVLLGVSAIAGTHRATGNVAAAIASMAQNVELSECCNTSRIAASPGRVPAGCSRS